MIFSRFFKNAWQSNDSNVRIAAVNDELELGNEQHNAILLDLLAHDDSELVRRAVLLKFNDFTTWRQASEQNSNKKVREYAQHQVEAIILGAQTLTLTAADKHQFLARTNKSTLLEAWLKVEADIELVVAIFNKIAKPQLLPSVFSQRQQSDIQLALLNGIEDKALLEKLRKKSKLADVIACIDEKIIAINEQAQKPEQVSKQTQLLLAKFLALKDVTDYQTVIERKASIIEQWQLVQNDFDCLITTQKQEFIDKYQHIEQQLQKIFAQKAEAFEQQKIAQQLEQQRVDELAAIDEQLKNCEQSLSNSIFEHNAIDETQFQQRIQTLNQLISDSVLSDEQKLGYQQKVQTLQHKLSKLPEIAHSVTEATHLISKISQLALPETLAQLNEREGQYHQWLSKFKGLIKQAQGALPESIANAYDEIVTQWQQALKPLQQQQKQQFTQAQKKLADVKRLIHNGKFNAAFGVFKKADGFYQLLNEKQQLRLAKDYQFAQEKIAELSDWEHYIATPRKQELLTKIKSLVDQPLDNPVAQAESVKQYRQQWNLLGHAEDDVEQALNTEFNQFCEHAFAPCRLYYAEQEQIRAQHLIERNALITQAEQLSDVLAHPEIDWQALDAKLNQLKQKWRNAGEIERAKYQTLNGQFNALLKPIKTALQQHYQENITKKQQLIKRAQMCLSQDDLDVAISDLKQLQGQWREIGYCGPRDENKLWHEFRLSNDQVFARRAQLNQEKKQQFDQLEQQYNEQLVAIINGYQDNNSQKENDVANLKLALVALTDLRNTVEQNARHFKALLKKVAQHSAKLEQALLELKKSEQQQVIVSLFELLQQMAEQDDIASVDISILPKNWQKIIANMPKTAADSEQRHHKTITLEILAGKASPEQDKNKRLSLQVELMQDQLTSGQAVNIEQLFVEWLNLGKLTPQDLPLLQRLQQVLLS